jgi:hypothetical protein
MSIYATLWTLKFPSTGQDYTGGDWITVLAQAVPAHIGTEGVDHYASFLPPVVDPDGIDHRAVVFVRQAARKETARSPQEYVDPLLMLTGAQYRSRSFQQLHDDICDALRAGRPRVVAEIFTPGGEIKIAYEDGSLRTATEERRDPNS